MLSPGFTCTSNNSPQFLIPSSSIPIIFKIKFSTYAVTLGDLRESAQETGEQTINGQAVLYPFYPTSKKAVDPTDIGLIKLDRTVAYTDTIQPIALPNPSYVPAGGDIVTIAGWGLATPEGQY
jgi:hypothetical protein